jgi:hypothetical protein
MITVENVSTVILIAAILVNKAFAADRPYVNRDYSYFFSIPLDVLAVSEYYFFEKLRWCISISPDEYDQLVRLKARVEVVFAHPVSVPQRMLLANSALRPDDIALAAAA